jgi:hypothetical protein
MSERFAGEGGDIGYDTVDVVRYRLHIDLDCFDPWVDHFGYDTVDWIEWTYHIPTRCRDCGAWIYGDEALASGKCWSCRKGGAA